MLIKTSELWFLVSSVQITTEHNSLFLEKSSTTVLFHLWPKPFFFFFTFYSSTFQSLKGVESVLLLWPEYFYTSILTFTWAQNTIRQNTLDRIQSTFSTTVYLTVDAVPCDLRFQTLSTLTGFHGCWTDWVGPGCPGGQRGHRWGWGCGRSAAASHRQRPESGSVGRTRHHVMVSWPTRLRTGSAGRDLTSSEPLVACILLQ